MACAELDLIHAEYFRAFSGLWEHISYSIGVYFFFIGTATTENAYVSVKNYTQGEYYLQNEQYEDCIVKFRGEVNRYPSDAKAQYYLGRCYLAMDKNRSALTHLKKAVVMDPRNPDYHFWQGVAYAANGKARS